MKCSLFPFPTFAEVTSHTVKDWQAEGRKCQETCQSNPEHRVYVSDSYPYAGTHACTHRREVAEIWLSKLSVIALGLKFSEPSSWNHLKGVDLKGQGWRLSLSPLWQSFPASNGWLIPDHNHGQSHRWWVAGSVRELGPSMSEDQIATVALRALLTAMDGLVYGK